MPRLRVLGGPNFDDLSPIQTNSGIPLRISSDLFEGEVAVYIKGFADEYGYTRHSSYFEHRERKHITWSIQAQGTYVCDDLLDPSED